MTKRLTVLQYLIEAADEGLTPKDLTVLAGCANRASVYTMLRRLAAQGLIRQCPDKREREYVWRSNAAPFVPLVPVVHVETVDHA